MTYHLKLVHTMHGYEIDLTNIVGDTEWTSIMNDKRTWAGMIYSRMAMQTRWNQSNRFQLHWGGVMVSRVESQVSIRLHNPKIQILSKLRLQLCSVIVDSTIFWLIGMSNTICDYPIWYRCIILIIKQTMTDLNPFGWRRRLPTSES